MTILQQVEAIGDWIIDRDLDRYHEREEDDGERGDVDDTEVERCDVGKTTRSVEQPTNNRHGAGALSTL